jgi:hypothetical protein
MLKPGACARVWKVVREGWREDCGGGGARAVGRPGSDADGGGRQAGSGDCVDAVREREPAGEAGKSLWEAGGAVGDA